MPLPQVQFSRSVISDSLRPHESQHARPLCPSPTPRVHPNPCPLSQWCRPTISSSVAPFSSCPQPFPASGSFQISSSHQVAKVLEFQLHISPSNENPGLISFRMDWLDLPGIRGTLKGLLQHHNSKASIIWRSAFFTVQFSHLCMTTGKTIALTRWTFVDKAMSLLFNLLSRLVITFHPRSKRLLISWLKSPSAAILEPRKVKVSQPLFPLFPHLFPMKWWDQMPWSSFSECWALSQLFHSSLSLSSRGSSVPHFEVVLFYIIA